MPKWTTSEKSKTDVNPLSLEHHDGWNERAVLVLTGKVYEEARKSVGLEGDGDWLEDLNSKQKQGEGKGRKNNRERAQTLEEKNVASALENFSRINQNKRKTDEYTKFLNIFILLSTFLLLIFTIWFHANHTARPIM